MDIGLGALLGGGAAKKAHDGHWTQEWSAVISAEYARLGRPLRVLVDYSSMPRTVYGSLVLEMLRGMRDKVESISAVYVGGRHASDADRSRQLLGLKSLIGTEGHFSDEPNVQPAFVLGLGFDGALAEAIIEKFQIEHFSCFLADPGSTPDAAERATSVNDYIISRAERTSRIGICDLDVAVERIVDLCEWYMDRRPVLLVPIGPKPLVLASLVVAAELPRIGLRWVNTTAERPVQVTVLEGTLPTVTEIRVRNET
jgi:hypothetical protein